MSLQMSHQMSLQAGASPTLLILLLLSTATPSVAGMCDSDEDPAATLLLPYFEVNLDDPAAGNTLFSINNARAEPALAHVTFWTDWSHPTVNFDVFLTGYDVVQVNLADVFLGGSLGGSLGGNVPITADAPSDPLDEISPHGGFRSDGGFTSEPRPEWDGGFPECELFFPFYDNPLIEAESYERMIDGHTGRPIPILDYKCLGATYGDNVARGYVTIDRVNRCSAAFPIDRFEPYFAPDGTGVASNVNQLWGDWFYVDRANGFAQGDALVHIEAQDGFGARGDGNAEGYTFYGRYTFAGEDGREPLGASWAVRYLNNALFAPGGTEFTVWRDPAVGQFEEIVYPCGFPGAPERGPGWHPLDESLVVAFDEFENSVEICGSSDTFCFPMATQRAPSANLGFTGESAPWGAGWMYLDLRRPEDDGLFGRQSQSYVSATHSAVGLLSVGLPAVELASACEN